MSIESHVAAKALTDRELSDFCKEIFGKPQPKVKLLVNLARQPGGYYNIISIADGRYMGKVTQREIDELGKVAATERAMVIHLRMAGVNKIWNHTLNSDE